MGIINEKIKEEIKSDAEKLIDLNKSLKEINQFMKYFNQKYKIPFEGGCDEGLRVSIHAKHSEKENSIYEFLPSSLGGKTPETELFMNFYLYVCHDRKSE